MQFGTADLRRGAFGQPSVPFLLSRRAHLLTTPKGRWYCLRQPCALRGGCGYCGSLWTMPHLCGAAVIVHAVGSRCLQHLIPSLQATVFYQLPVKNINLMFFTAMGIASSATTIFFLRKRNKNKDERTVKRMAIYHLEAKVVSRGTGRSAVAASAYLSCTNILNDYDGVRHDFTRKKGLVWQDVFLPEFAPAEWKDRGVLWNAVEENEKT